MCLIDSDWVVSCERVCWDFIVCSKIVNGALRVYLMFFFFFFFGGEWSLIEPIRIFV